MMDYTYGWKILIFASLQWLAFMDPASTYLQLSVNGYLFTIPGFNDQEKRTQSDAQTWCTRNQSNLLEITNDTLQSSVVSFINNARNQNQMTGNNVMTNGKRSMSNYFTWVNGQGIGSSLEVHGQGPGLSQSYGYLNSSQSGYAFFADAPTVTRGYICEGSSSMCTDGFKVNGRCYKSSSETMSWFGARNRCLDGGGDLASFEFISNVQGFSILNGSGWNQPSTYWVGLQRLLWKWQGSGSDVKYSQWSDGHPDYATSPNKDCLCLNPNNPIYDWKWLECDCNLTYQFVCLTETPSTSSTSSSTSVSMIDVISSTQIKTGTTTSHPVNSPPSITNSEYSFTITVPHTSVPAGSEGYKLPVGLGVGLGGSA